MADVPEISADSSRKPRTWAWTLAVLLLLALYVLAYTPVVYRIDALRNRVSPDDTRAGLAYVQLLQSGNIAKILASADSSVISYRKSGVIRRLISVLPSGPGTSVVPVYANWEWGAKSLLVLTYDIRNQHAWAGLAVTLGRSRTGTKLEGFSVQRFLVPPEQIYGFTLSRKTPLEYAALAVAIIIALLTWTAAFICALTPRLRFKWLWLIGIFIGLIRFQLDWTSGGYQLMPIAFLVPPATALKTGFFSPWVLQMSIPLFAILFLTRRKTLISLRTTASPEVAHD